MHISSSCQSLGIHYYYYYKYLLCLSYSRKHSVRSFYNAHTNRHTSRISLQLSLISSVLLSTSPFPPSSPQVLFRHQLIHPPTPLANSSDGRWPWWAYNSKGISSPLLFSSHVHLQLSWLCHSNLPIAIYLYPPCFGCTYAVMFQ